MYEMEDSEILKAPDKYYFNTILIHMAKLFMLKRYVIL